MGGLLFIRLECFAAKPHILAYQDAALSVSGVLARHVALAKTHHNVGCPLADIKTGQGMYYVATTNSWR